MSKAYDCLNHYTLINKLVNCNVPKGIIAIIKSLYFNQKFYTTYNSSRSSNENVIRNGVRQGGVLSGLLFNIYINELVENINNSGVGCTLKGAKFSLIAFCDDLVIMAPTKSSLQFLLNLVSVELK